MSKSRKPVKMWIAFSSNSMQPDAKVEKKRATSYLMEVKGHVILAKICYFRMILKISSTFY